MHISGSQPCLWLYSKAPPSATLLSVSGVGPGICILNNVRLPTRAFQCSQLYIGTTGLKYNLNAAFYYLSASLWPFSLSYKVHLDAH